MSERQKIFDEISAELNNADGQWDEVFDDNNTANDWVAFITAYAGQAVKVKVVGDFNCDQFYTNMKKVAGLAISALESCRRGGPAPRHYD